MTFKRSSGVLMHISSLPGANGIGSFGQAAYDFVDFLVETGQTYWQILPLTPTGYGDSPYQSFSALAGNINFIDLPLLAEMDLLVEEDFNDISFSDNPEKVDYERLVHLRRPILEKAVAKFLTSEINIEALKHYLSQNDWLNDYAEFMAIKEHFGQVSLQDWPDQSLRLRQQSSLDYYRRELVTQIDFHLVTQYLFDLQWRKLKAYSNQRHIAIIGDMPIYVAADSVEVWTMPDLFKVDEDRVPWCVAGCPADDFSKDGQLWGNPIYNWSYHKETKFKWWVYRIQESFKRYDVLRIDHFKGFSDFWEIPRGYQTPNDGSWVSGPGYELFETVKSELGDLPIIAENLGYIDEKAEQLLKETDYPGMKILEFGFYDTSANSLELPHYHTRNQVIYTGTHDNAVINEWYQELEPNQRDFVIRFTHKADYETVAQAMIRTLYSSVADISIITMQDLLEKDGSCRMNLPNTIGGNWEWRMKLSDLTQPRKDFLKEITYRYNRQNLYNDKKSLNQTSFKDYYLSHSTNLEDLSNTEVYELLLNYVKDKSDQIPQNKSSKTVYYISAEFLIGKLLSNNLINLGIYDEVRLELEHAGKNLADIEAIEYEPSLGNGGLGRLAACFIDSMSTLGINGQGIGLNYHCGLFKQIFKNYKQEALPDYWQYQPSWLLDTGISYEIPFKDFVLQSSLKQLSVLGYKQTTKNMLHLFDLIGVNPSIIHDGIQFDKKDILENLTLFLYPDDSDEAGQRLRIFQEYFMVSNAAQLILDKAKQQGSNLYDLDSYAYIQINDTHPSLIIPELIRLLTEKYSLNFNTAISVVSRMIGYTNHTILAEALEKWDLAELDTVIPNIAQIIRKLDYYVKEKYPSIATAIIDEHNRVHMAHMDIHFATSVNGVAALHTEILKNSELKEFYTIYPEKFNNKTNGITFRRWLEYANRPLTTFLKSVIGDSYLTDSMRLEKLLDYNNQNQILDKLSDIKLQNKKNLASYLKLEKGIELDENSVISIQIKRFHEYKRQQMNALYCIYKYLDIKKGNKPARKITIIFAGKAAPAYTIAQDIIHLILCLSTLINNDPEVNPYLNVHLIDNYNVSLAEKLIPAADISEQISLASKEASGTGNMKLMLNGAITLGTKDGANVEIAELVGEENCYTFGKSSEEVIEYYKNQSYSSLKMYKNSNLIKEVVDFMLSDEILSIGDKNCLERLYRELISKDWFMTFLDFEEYVAVKDKVFTDFENRKEWQQKMLVNIAKAGYFSSDRTIKDYARDIWGIL